jgi:hypothetical protein
MFIDEAAEIHASFHRLPRRKQIEAWICLHEPRVGIAHFAAPLAHAHARARFLGGNNLDS